jgi:diacylglycerol kinase (ATP)
MMKINQFKPKGYFSRIYRSFINSCSGFYFLFKNEKSFQQELIFFFITLTFALFFKFSNYFLIVFIAILVLVIESMNTAIERVCDEISCLYNQNIRIAKDVSSFAVFLLIILYMVIYLSNGYSVFL